MNIIFNIPPISFNHWCSVDKTTYKTKNCLDCAYMKKYNVNIKYAVYNGERFITYTNEDDIVDFGEFCLLLFFINIYNTNSLYVSIFKKHPSITREYIEDNYFYDNTIIELYNTVECQKLSVI